MRCEPKKHLSFTAPKAVIDRRSTAVQLIIERNFGIEHLGDRAVLLGAPRDLGETGLVDSRPAGLERQIRARDLDAVAILVERDLRRRLERAVGNENGAAASRESVLQSV